MARTAWMAALAGAVAWTGWCGLGRLRRVEAVSAAAREGYAVDGTTVSGYAGAKRWLIVPEHHTATYQWIESTQGMLADGDWRVRRIANENAPEGRDVRSASPFRWWLLAVAGAEHVLTGHPLALAVERAAAYAAPVAQLLLLVGAAVFAARFLGRVSAAALCVGLAALFPAAAGYLPGILDDNAVAALAPFVGALLLAAGFRSSRPVPWFVAAGVAGGLGLWVGAPAQLPFLAGVGLGGLAAALTARGAPAPPWRAWALAGAVTALAGYFVEYAPHDLDFELRANYPLYGVAWLGLGECLHQCAGAGRRGTRPRWTWAVATTLGLAGLTALPWAAHLQGISLLLDPDLLATRLTNLPDGTVAAGLSAWFDRGGIDATLASTLAPLLVLGPAAWALITSEDPRRRAVLGVVIGPAVIEAALATRQLRWWGAADLALAAVAAVGLADGPGGPSAATRGSLAAALLLAAGLGVPRLLPAPSDPTAAGFKFTRAEIEGLYERALAQWISDHADAPAAVVYVPPFRGPSFSFYGGLRVVGTPSWENREGLAATFRIAIATRPEETQALLGQRSVDFIVLPSWDLDLDAYAEAALTKPHDSFIYALRATDGGIFPWLQPLAYALPDVAGFHENSVLVLRVADEADPATVRSRLVEYLVEMHDVERAAKFGPALGRYPSSLAALAALAQLEKAEGDDHAFAATFGTIVSIVGQGNARGLPWDRRVSLAVVLAVGGQNDLAAAEVRRCLAGVDAPKLRALTTGSLYHFLFLLEHFGIELPDPRLHELAHSLLPEELRRRL